MKNSIKGKLVALLVAISITFNISPIVFGESIVDLPESNIEELEEVDDIEGAGDPEGNYEIEKFNEAAELKSLGTTIESLEISGSKIANAEHVITAKASSPNGVLYQFYVKDKSAIGPAWTVVQDYSEKDSASWVPEKQGDYLYGVHVKDKKSKERLDTHLYEPISIKAGEGTVLGELEISGDKLTNTAQTITAKASSPNGVLYEFYVKDLSAVGPAWTVVQSYSEKTSASWVPKKEGDYLYGVHVKDKESKERLDTHLYKDVSIQAGVGTELEKLEISGDKMTNTAQTITAKASSPNGVLYEFYVKDLNAVGPAWTVIQSYSEKSSASWVPRKEGDYWYGVHVKDKKSKERLDTHRYIDVSIESGTKINSLNIDGSNLTNTAHTITAKASSPNGALYEFYVKDLNAVGPAWTVIQRYSEKTSANWTPKKDGDYLYGVHVKDKKSKERLDTHLYEPISISPIPPAKLDSLEISGLGYQNRNHVLTAKGSSKNGVLYQFYIKDLKTNRWRMIQDYSEKNTANWKPDKAGDYWYGVHIKDKKSKNRLDDHIYKSITINTSVKYNVTNYNDTLAEALEKQDGRNKIRRNNEWVFATKDEIEKFLNPDRFLQFTPEASKGEDKYIVSIEVDTATLNVRRDPNTSSPVLGTVKNGDVYVVLEERTGWYKLNAGGKIGWVSSNFVKLVNDVPQDMYQFMVLSGQAGATLAQMNRELVDEGILEGRGAAFIEGSKKYNINELYLMAHAFLETGRGTSRLATGIHVTSVDGKPVTPRTVYNMYGIGARDVDPERLGSEMAYKEGWFTPDIAITEGAHWISKNYINNQTYKQDTLYKMKYNPANPGTHQYATDIAWAVKQNRQIDIMMDICKRVEGIVLSFDIPKYR